ncbi:MAG TPA: hypothetical protein VL463_09885 [Kofleriaceae bacterium]|jgi:hypothetical protein|nr:hypothetical protein [Kofleriaceae bacterium]
MSKSWFRAYAIAFVPVLVGMAIGGAMIWRVYSQVTGMQRLVVPGERDVILEAGSHVGFLESKSVVDGTEYANATFSGRCTLAEAGSNAPVELGKPTGTTSYSFGSYAGTSAFSFTAPHDGTYHLACSGDGPPAVLAIGDGIGLSIVIGAIGGLAGVIVAIVMALRIRKRRKREAHGSGSGPGTSS